MAAFKTFKETSLPGTPQNNAIYIIAPPGAPDFVEIYVTSAAGAVKRVIKESDVQALIDASLSAFNNLNVVADITARDALTLSADALVLVKDASDDATVESGAATYVYEHATTSYEKIAEYESLDLTLEWDDIQNRPTATPAQIDTAVSNSHVHANTSSLNKIGEDGDGNLTYDGELPPTKWDSTNW